MGKLKDLTGLKFGRLVVIKQVIGTKRTSWLCKCECGQYKIVRGNHLVSREIQSCGCLHKEIIKNNFKTHGLSNTRVYNIWCGMKFRCYNPNCKEYKLYGERGIIICNEWKDNFSNFYEWSIKNGYKEISKRDLYTLDRIDVNGNYEPTNCRWVNMKVQNNNRRNNHRITYKGETHTLKEWSEILNMKYTTLCMRITKYKWTAEKAFNTPIKGKEKYNGNL